MKNLKIYFILLSAVLIGCEKQNATDKTYTIGVDINQAKSIDLSPELKIGSFIPLELTDSSMIKEISKVYITQEHVFVVDLRKHELFLFDRENGSFIRNIGQKGEGPGEYRMFNDVFFDEETNLIYAYERIKHKMQVYKLSGELVEEIPSNYWFNAFCKTKEGFWVYTPYPDENPDGYALMLLNENLDKKINGFLPQKKFFPALDGIRFVKDEESSAFYFTYPFSNIIYELREQNPTPFFTIDFGKKTLPYAKIHEITDEEYFANLKNQNDYLGDIVNVNLYKNKLYFSFSNISGASYRYSTIFDIENNKTDVISGFRKYTSATASNYSFESLTLTEPIATCSDGLIYPVSPYSLSANDLFEIGKQSPFKIDKEANPILFIMR